MENATTNTSRSVKPNGKKIKDRRNELGKTQKALIHNNPDAAGLRLRTYQRAEQGKPISPYNLQAIATVLGLEYLDVLENENAGDKSTRRLNRLVPPSASTLVSFLRDDVDSLGIDFEIDPDEEQAEILAEMAETCERIRCASFFDQFEGEDKHLTPAEKIRVIGRLNTLLNQLFEAGVYLFYGSVIGWDRTGCFSNRRGPLGVFMINYPQRFKRAEIIFSSIDENFRYRDRHFRTREQAFADAIAHNFGVEGGPVHPAYVDFPLAFKVAYKAAFIEKYGKPDEIDKTEIDVPV